MYLVACDLLFGSLVHAAAAIGEIGGIGANQIHLSANVGGVQSAHVGADHPNPILHPIEGGVPFDQLCKGRLQLHCRAVGHLAVGAEQKRDHARAASEIRGASAGIGANEGRQKISIGAKGEALLLLDQLKARVDPI